MMSYPSATIEPKIQPSIQAFQLYQVVMVNTLGKYSRIFDTRIVSRKIGPNIKGNPAMPSRLIDVPLDLQKEIFECQTEDNWDDEEAIGVTPKACESAVKFLQTVFLLNPSVKRPKVSPSVYGSVSLHWRCNDSHLVVRPSPDLDLAYYRYETADENPSISGDEAKLQVAIRVVDFLKAAHAKQS